MIFCQHGRDRQYRNDYRYLISQRRRERRDHAHVGKDVRFIDLALRPLRLCEKTGCQTPNIVWFSGYTKIDNNCQIKSELLQIMT